MKYVIKKNENYVPVTCSPKATTGTIKTNFGNFDPVTLLGIGKSKGLQLIELTPEIQKILNEKELEQKYKVVCDDFKLNAPPTIRQFTVGESVLVKPLKDATIEKVLDNGKLLLVKHLKKGREEFDYYPWVNVFKVINETTTVFTEANFDTVRFDTFKMNIHGVLSTYYHWGFNMDPEYQRGYVWSDEDKEILFDSIFKGIDIGKIAWVYVCNQNNEPQYEILDGKQRLQAIIDFTEDRYKYKGYYFSELNDLDKKFLMNRFQIVIVEVIDNLPLINRYEYFIKLNTAGRVMDQSHLNEVIERYNQLKESN